MRKPALFTLTASMMLVFCMPAAAEESTGILPAIAGDGTTYANLFEVILDEQYDQIWLDSSAAVIGEDMAEEAVASLKEYISSDLYGEDAIAAFSDGGYAFDCWYINDASAFTFEGDTITIQKTDGTEETHTYTYLGSFNVGEGETMEYNGTEFEVAFPCDVYESTDDAGEFTYFFLRDDTMEDTYHIEFRYGSNLEDLQGYFVGPYAFWLAAGIDQEADEETIQKVIDLFVTENLAGEDEESMTE